MRLLKAMNLLLAIAATVYLVLFGIELCRTFNKVDNAFRWRITGPYWWAYWLRALWLLFPLLFWFRKFRTIRWMSVTAAAFVLLYSFIEQLVIIAITSFRDARPAAWVYYPAAPMEYVVTFIAYLILLAVVYFVLSIMEQRRPIGMKGNGKGE